MFGSNDLPAFSRPVSDARHHFDPASRAVRDLRHRMIAADRRRETVTAILIVTVALALVWAAFGAPL